MTRLDDSVCCERDLKFKWYINHIASNIKEQAKKEGEMRLRGNCGYDVGLNPVSAMLTCFIYEFGFEIEKYPS